MNRRTLAVLAALACSAFSPASAGAATLFTLTGHGWGHGIGMSQYGALGYAEHGWTWKQILAHYYSHTTLGTLRRGTREKVLLVQSRPSIHVTLGTAATASDSAGTHHTLAAGSYRIDPGTSAGKLRVWSSSAGRYIWRGAVTQLRLTPGSTPLRLDDTSLNGYAQDHWWGDFLVTRASGALMLVNDVPMERYVRGVVPCEVPASWAPAAVRAQAVAARSYAAATRRSGSFDAYPDTRSQEYCPIERQAAASDAAVKATARTKVVYGGHVATTFFSSSSGGRTSSISASWGGTDLPYLVPVRDRYDGAGGANPNHTWSPKLYTTTGLAAALGLGHPVGSLDMTIDDPSQRVLSMLVHTGAVDTPLTASQVFSDLGLRSTYFRLIQQTLSVPKRSIANQQFQLQGRIWPRPSAHFTLEAKVGTGGAWTPIRASVTLGSDGRFSLTRSPTADVSYRIVRRGVFSPVVSVRVHPALTLTTTGGAFNGHVVPLLQGAGVTLQRLSGSTWTDSQTVAVDGQGDYTFTTAVSSGSWRVHYGGDADHGSAISATVVVP